MNQYLLMNQLHLPPARDSELYPNINSLFMIKCSMIMITKINIFRSQLHYHQLYVRMVLVHSSVQDLHCYRYVEQQQQTCSINMSIHNNVNKATSLGVLQSTPEKYQKFVPRVHHKCIHIISLQCQHLPTIISIIENLQAEACDTAYWHLQVTEACWKAK